MTQQKQRYKHIIIPFNMENRLKLHDDCQPVDFINNHNFKFFHHHSYSEPKKYECLDWEEYINTFHPYYKKCYKMLIIEKYSDFQK